MSWDDKMFMAKGHRVRHKYTRRPKCHAKCELCGVKRKRARFGEGRNWVYLKPGKGEDWSMSNPPCALKPKKREGGGHPGPMGGPGYSPRGSR